MNPNNPIPRYDPDGETQPFWPEDSLAQTRPALPVNATPLPGLVDNNKEEPAGITSPLPAHEPMATFQAIRLPPKPRRRKRPARPFWLVAVFLLAAYFLAPLRTHMVVLGIDRTPDGTAVGRSDTIILTGITPLAPTVRMLSIPRDLYLDIPGVGLERINTAHFYAEAERPGSGPKALARVVQQSFGVRVPYYVRVRFDGFLEIFNAMGGVVVDLPEPMAGYPAGRNHLSAEQALAFVRDRSGTDDFFRMSHTHLMVRAALRQILRPSEWARLPAVAAVSMRVVDTNLPVWQWPRLGLALLRATLTGNIDSCTIEREMVTPYVTAGGGQVLLPNWDLIHPLIAEMFGGL